MDDTADNDMRSTTDDLANTAKEAASDLAEHGRDWLEKASECVRKHPAKSLLAAVGFGALAAVLIRRLS